MTTLALVLALALPVCALPSLSVRADGEAEEIVQYADDDDMTGITEVGCWALFALIALDIIKLV